MSRHGRHRREASCLATVIETHDLVNEYGALKAVDHLNIGAEEGRIFSLLGPNGAGKTTTVEILEGLRTPTSGSAEVLGHDVRTEYVRIRRRVGKPACRQRSGAGASQG